MKRMIRIFVPVLVLVLCLVPFAGCGGGSQSGPTNNILNVWSFTDEVPRMLEKYKELNSDFDYEFNVTIINTEDGAYQPALDQALAGGGADAPDFYCAESAFVIKYTQGDASHFAAPYSELGIDVTNKINAAQVATYAYEIGTRGDNAVVGLPYQATGGAFIYRRSIAQDVWGSDDPAVVKTKIGPGWDKFMQAAAELGEKGYAAVSGDGDLWQVIRSNAQQGWIVNDKFNLDPGYEIFLDISKAFLENGWHNDTRDWQDPWFADMAGNGPKPVLGFFGPAWLINYVMVNNVGDTFGDWAVCEPPTGFSWGGTWLIANKDSQHKEAIGRFFEWVTLDTSDDGLQYHWANGTLEGPDGTKDTVSSAVVMSRSNGTVELLGGQNMFEVFAPAGASASGSTWTQYDETINIAWRDQVRMYSSGQKDKAAAIADFKARINDELGIEID